MQDEWREYIQVNEGEPDLLYMECILPGARFIIRSVHEQFSHTKIHE